jgi:hypothetical protein
MQQRQASDPTRRIAASGANCHAAMTGHERLNAKIEPADLVYGLFEHGR